MYDFSLAELVCYLLIVPRFCVSLEVLSFRSNLYKLFSPTNTSSLISIWYFPDLCLLHFSAYTLKIQDSLIRRIDERVNKVFDTLFWLAFPLSWLRKPGNQRIGEERRRELLVQETPCPRQKVLRKYWSSTELLRRLAFAYFFASQAQECGGSRLWRLQSSYVNWQKLQVSFNRRVDLKYTQTSEYRADL